MKQFKKAIMMFLLWGICGMAHAQSMYWAQRYYDEGKFLEAAKQLRPLADGGDADAQYMAGLLFFEGKGVNKNKAQAEKYLKLAALQGHEKAIAELCSKFYTPALEWKKMEDLFTEVLARNENMRDKGLEFGIGMVRWYQGGDSDKLKEAWMTMYKNKAKWDQGSEQVYKYSQELYPILIKEKIGNPAELTKSMRELWNINHTYSFPWIDDMIDGIRKHSKEIQSEYFQLLKKESEKRGSVISRGMSEFTLGLMQMEGLGTEANMTSGLTHVKQSYVLKFSKMQSEIFNWQDMPKPITDELIKLIKEEQEKKARQEQAAKEKAERERKLANIKVVRAPYSQITAYLKSAKCVNGKLEVVVTSTSKLALSYFQLNNRVIVKNTSGLSIPNKARIKVSGLKSEFKSDGRLIYYFNHGDVATFTITISDMTYSGELGEIYFDFNMSGSKEYIKIQNLIW
ncbi:MAG: sel1 repeat family protein [Prevotella sp.]|nr:sel1 repeat family protein [Prevotella sp.]